MSARAAVGLVAALLVVSSTANASTPSVERRIQSRLQLRAEAYNSGDKQAFLAAIDPASTALRESQSNWYDRAKSVPLTDLSLQLRVDRYGDLTRTADKAAFGGPVVVSRVQARFGIPEYTERPWLDELTLTFVERDGEWLIASDSALDNLAIYSDRQPWDFGPITKQSSEHFLMISHPQDRDFAEQLLPLAESALAEVDRAYRAQWLHRVPIFVPSSKSELERLLGATFDVDNFVAFALFSVDADNGFAISGNRIVLNRTNFARYSPEGRKSIFAHELLHVATRTASGPFIPYWIEEGYAQLAEQAGPPNTREFERQVGRGNFDGVVPEDFEFVSGGQQAIIAAYQESASAVVFIRSRFSLDKLEALYARLGAVKTDAGTPKYHVDKAMREILGLSLADFQGQWAADVKK